MLNGLSGNFIHSRRQPLNGYNLGALLFCNSKNLIWIGALSIYNLKNLCCIGALSFYKDLLTLFSAFSRQRELKLEW